MRAADGTVVAIDGPAASGKSTLAIALARRLGLELMDTGSMYRAVALLAVERGVPFSDGPALETLADEVGERFRMELPETGRPRVFLGEREVTGEIRRPEVSEAVSPVSVHGGVRERMVELQRSLAGAGGAVVEGRDTGTVVFPGASLKVFLDASGSERARRRHEELEQKGVSVPIERVSEEIRARDSIDSGRDHSPLRPAGGALVIDTSRMSVESVVEAVTEALADRGLLAD